MSSLIVTSYRNTNVDFCIQDAMNEHYLLGKEKKKTTQRRSALSSFVKQTNAKSQQGLTTILVQMTNLQ